MARKYMIWKNKVSTGIHPDWLEISGAEFFTLLNSPEGQGRFFIVLDNDICTEADVLYIEATKEQYRDWYKENCHHQYLKKFQPKKAVLSLDAAAPEDETYCGVCGHAMKRDNRKNATYCCRTNKLNTGFRCTDDRHSEAEIMDAVIDTIQVYAQYAVDADRLMRVQRERRQLDKKQVQRQLQVLRSKQSQLEKRLQDLYETFVEGEISREHYLSQRQSITQQTDEVTAAIRELERKSKSDDSSSSSVIERYKGYAGVTKLTSEISNDILRRVTIFPDDVMEIQLNYQDKLETAMRELKAITA